MNVYMCINYKKKTIKFKLETNLFYGRVCGKVVFSLFCLSVCLSIKREYNSQEKPIKYRGILTLSIDSVIHGKKTSRFITDFYLYFIEKYSEKANFQFNLVNTCKT